MMLGLAALNGLPFQSPYWRMIMKPSIVAGEQRVHLTATP
jgi:hypothetical protein